MALGTGFGEDEEVIFPCCEKKRVVWWPFGVFISSGLSVWLFEVAELMGLGRCFR